MKISVIGTGYVGLVSGTCFSEIGHEVTCIDIDQRKVDMLKAGESPIYEPGLNELLTTNIESSRLNFSNDYNSVSKADAIFLAVGTPSLDSGEANLEYLFDASKTVALNLKENAVVVIKSTVPVGTCEKIREIISANTDKRVHVVNNPEFLKEGSAIEDFMRPDRIVIGYDQEYAAGLMDELYAPLTSKGYPLYKMSNLSAELTKYAANCFLATKISFINEIASLCDAIGADINEVRQGITTDRRIGEHFLYAGPGYGGSCFPKDVKALISTAKNVDIPLKIVQAAEDVNVKQKLRMYFKIKDHFKGNISDKKFTFWGVAFKPNTDDVREAPAIYMAEALVEAGATVNFYDPVASKNFLMSIDNPAGKITSEKNMYEALNNSDGLVVMTEWDEFRAPDFKQLEERLNSKVIFDARNIFNTEQVKAEGFDYYAIGKRI